MRHVAVYLPIDPQRVGKGRREFLYVEALSREQVRQHAEEHAPKGWILVDVRAARDDMHYLEVPNV